jgi:AcrR family transcriptional regulator
MAEIVKPRPTKKAPEAPGSTGRAAGNSSQRTPGLPGAGSGLPPTARRLLEAAGRLLARSGYNSLSVEAIGREAGENKALIRYYFGSKNGLIVALIDWLISDTLWRNRQRLSGISNEHSPSQALTTMSEALLDDPPSYRLFFDLLPRVLENPSMAKQFAELYRAYRDQNVRTLWAGQSDEAPAVMRDIAVLTVALSDGLAVQILAEPGSVDVSRALATWGSFIDHALASISDDDQVACAEAPSQNG